MSKLPLGGRIKKLKRAAMTLKALDDNKEIRAALIARITKKMATAPVLVLHQVAQVLDLWTE